MCFYTLCTVLHSFPDMDYNTLIGLIFEQAWLLTNTTIIFAILLKLLDP